MFMIITAVSVTYYHVWRGFLGLYGGPRENKGVSIKIKLWQAWIYIPPCLFCCLVYVYCYAFLGKCSTKSLVDSMSQLPSLCIATLSTALVYCESSICFDKMKRGLQLMLYCNGIMCWIHLLRIERTLLLSITKLPSLPAGALGKGRGKKSTSLFWRSDFIPWDLIFQA